ncbi:MAG: tRNA 2-thiouridine(34) synthase MnmA [Spirochaetales bacterium]|jgi:tRNA-specific 2-thiouridylase|nr:tRNA 2-thiouridine(34) synthase MnmA [Spirochaetales bacterium]
MKEKALIAMSGGVDSSVAAFLAKESGFDCAGVTLKLFDSEDLGKSREKSCCSLADTQDAREAARKIGIPFFVYNFSEVFRERVMRRFAQSYLAGLTPNPCIDCNRFVKWGALLQRAELLDFRYIVTGHYAKIQKNGPEGRFLLKKGEDAEKDQSYVLYAMKQEELAHTLFPLGEMRKSETRALAEARGFSNARKKDSQDICFVPGGDYGAFIENYTGRLCEKGPILNTKGEVLGEHRGALRYTVGQRRGRGVSGAKPFYVTSTCVETNTVFLGEEGELYSKGLFARDINIIPFRRLDAPLRVRAKIRYRQKEQWATVEQTGEDEFHLEFEEAQRAVTRGQAVVLYDGDVVVGGGTIAGTLTGELV